MVGCDGWHRTPGGTGRRWFTWTRGPGETVGSVLERLGVRTEEIAHIFLNGALLTTCNSMAPWLRYQRVREDVPTCEPNLDTPVQDGDRLGLFGRDMAMLVV
jgi:hypothetical protein